MRAPRPGEVVIVAALACAGALVGVELGRGALGEGPLTVPDPCSREVAVPGDSLDAHAQRIGLRALDVAACRLGTTRERLLLDAAESLGESRSLPDGTEDAIRDGLETAIDREEDEDRIGGITAFLLRQAARRAPVEWIVRAVEGVAPLVS